MLVSLYGDGPTSDILSEETLIRSWLRVEAALATAQAEVGVLDPEHAEAISAACSPANVDAARLWQDTRNVGDPILSLVRQLGGAPPERHRRRGAPRFAPPGHHGFRPGPPAQCGRPPAGRAARPVR